MDCILWEIKKKDWVRYPTGTIMTYSRVMAEAYVKMYLDGNKARYLLVPRDLYDTDKLDRYIIEKLAAGGISEKEYIAGSLWMVEGVEPVKAKGVRGRKKG